MNSLKNDESSLMWEELSVKHLVQNEWIDFRECAYRLPDGSVFEPFYSYTRRDYVVVVASDTDGKYLCVRQFRQGIRRITTEFPAGGIENSDGEGSDASQKSVTDKALDAAKRELLEETGYESDEWRHLLSIPAQATISDNYAHLFEAVNCRKVAGQTLDDAEFLNVISLTADETEQLIKSGDFQQAVHVAAWYLSRRKEDRVR